MRKCVVVAVLLFFSLGTVLAQDADKKPSGGAAQGAMMTKPAAEMQKLIKTFSGTWNTSETFEKNEMMPEGGTGHGTSTFKAGPGGLSMIQDYKSRSRMGTFAGHGVTWWDADAQGYKSVWCDSMANKCQVSNGLGNWKGNDVVFNDEQDMNGKKHQTKIVDTNITPRSFTMTADSGPQGEMKRFMTINYTKAGGAAPAGDKKPSGKE
jgi:hypothetical protein